MNYLERIMMKSAEGMKPFLYKVKSYLEIMSFMVVLLSACVGCIWWMIGAKCDPILKTVTEINDNAHTFNSTLTNVQLEKQKTALLLQVHVSDTTVHVTRKH